MAIGRINATLTGVQPGGLAKIVPTSVAVGSGSGSVDSNGNVTFSGASSISLNGCFSSTYTDYLLLVNFTGASTNLNTSMRMRSNGTDFSSSAYDRGGVLNPYNTGLTALANQGQTLWDLGGINSTYPSYSQWQITFKSPNTTNDFKSTFALGTYVNSLGTGVMWWSNNVVYSSTQFDGFSMNANTGNFTGTLRIYGYTQ